MKLNIGSGALPLPDFVNVDRTEGAEAYPLSYADGSVDEIRASHVLEHFSHRQTLDVVKEWARALKPGGIMRIAVPDFDKITKFYADGTDSRVEAYLMGGHVDENDKHGAIFNQQKLTELMRLAGLRRIHRWKSEHNDCASLPVSLNLAGFKPVATKVEKVSAILSMPRLSFTDQVACMTEATLKLKLPTRIRQGVFWGQTLTAAMETSIKEDAPKYLLTMDYDTLFKPEDVEDLYQIMEAIPHIDALCPMQMGRDRDTVLLTIRQDADQNKRQITRDSVEAETLPLNTGHFGLTMIRVESLQKLPRPWFLHKPDPEGGWGEGRTDEDIYFWRKWEECGFTLHQANQVVVGHAQLVATWPDKNIGPIHQYINDYRRDGKPEGVFA